MSRALLFVMIYLVASVHVVALEDKNLLSRVGKTSLQMAAIRAVASESHLSPYHDPLAECLTTPEDIIRSRERSKKNKKNVVSPHICRHMILDELIRRALSSATSTTQVKQVVILGAGMDTRAHRLAMNQGIKWFEVDMVEVIQLKEKLLNQQGIFLSQFVVRVGFQFEHDDLAALIPQLEKEGYNPNVATIFVMEGLVYYMDADFLATLFLSLPKHPDSSILVSITTAKTRAYFIKHSERTKSKHMWKCDLEGLKRASVFPPKGWRVSRKLRTNTRGARSLQLGIKVPRMSFPNSLGCPGEVIFELVPQG